MTPTALPPTPALGPQPADAFEELDHGQQPDKPASYRKPATKGTGRVVWIAVGLLFTGVVAGTIFLIGGKATGPGSATVPNDLPASPVDGILDKLEASQKRFRELERKTAESQRAVDAATATAEQAEAMSRRFAGMTKDGGLDLIEGAQKARQRAVDLSKQHLLSVAAMKAESEKMEQLVREFTREYQRERDRVDRLTPDQRQPASERLDRWLRRSDAATR